MTNTLPNIQPGSRVMMTSGAREGSFGVVTRWSEKSQKYSITMDDGLKIRCRKNFFKMSQPRTKKRAYKKCREDFDPDTGLIKQLPFEYPKSAINISKKREALNLKLMGRTPRKANVTPQIVVDEQATIFDIGKIARRMNKTNYLNFPSVDGFTSDEVKCFAGEDSWGIWEPVDGMGGVVKYVWREEGFSLVRFSTNDGDKYLVIQTCGLGIGPLIKIIPPKEDSCAGLEDLTQLGDANSFIMETLLNPWNIIMSGQSEDGSISPEHGRVLLDQFPSIVEYMRKELQSNKFPAETRAKIEVTLLSVWILQKRYSQREKEYSKVRFNCFLFLKEALRWPSNIINHFLQAMTYAH